MVKTVFKIALLPLCLVLLFVCQTAFGQSPVSGLPYVRNFHTLEYKAGIQNLDIVQDKRGLIYVANNFGLLEYDGDQWQIYYVKNATKVRSIAIDARGRIYTGCQGDFGYFFPNKNGQLVYTSLADSLPQPHTKIDETWSVYIDNDRVYFCTFSTVYIYDGKTFQAAEAPNSISLSFLVNRKLYVTGYEKGISLLSGSNIEPIKGGSLFSKISISAIIPSLNDQLIIATTQDGIFELSNTGELKPWNKDLQNFFKKGIVKTMIRLRNGNFAIGTQNEGLLIVTADGKTLMQLTRGRGLENRTVLNIYEDDLDNLWIGHNNGLAYIELGSPFTFINERSGLPGTGYSGYLDNGQLYLGTNTGLYIREKNGLSDFRLIENTSGQVYHIGRYNGDLLVGHHNGAMRVEGSKAVQISSEQGSWIFLPLMDDATKLIGGTYTGLQLFKKENGHWKDVKKIGGGFEESSRVMAQDQSNSIWVTHGYKGAYRVSLNASRDSVIGVKHFGAENGFPTNTLINVFKIRNELLFTSESGIFKYDEKKQAFVSDELFSTILGKNVQIWYMQEDALGNIYFIGREHIGVLRKNSMGEYELEADAFNKIRKFLNDDLENITILKNNQVIFGAKDGFIHYDPVMRVNRKPIFKTLIRRVTSTNDGDSVLFYGNYVRNDTIVDEQQNVNQPDLTYSHNSVNFTFAATSYEGDADLVYQYYLDNYEKTWADWNKKTQKEYTNLKEGHYVFHVRAKNINGEISPEASFEFHIYPPWFRSIWAYSFYGLSVMALLFTGFNILDRKYQREQKIMAQKQEEELVQKENELSKLSQKSHEEISRLQNEKLESELQHMNNELATSTMHLLNKNEFITSIKNNLGHIIKKSSNEEVRKELHQITKDIENNISADSDWEQFQFHFDRVHGDFSNRFKAAFPALSPQDIKLSAYLRMNLSTKEIAQLLNISVRGVEISRYRLRKKLSLDRNRNLQDFILNF
jgi:ligand-binding sensor domain-containing protein/DNA-binding CsgD family transcriptional regulator